MVLRIRELRRSAGMRQSCLAERMGVTQSVISEWEKEVYLPKTRQLPALAETLGCTINDLFVPSDKASQANEVLAG